MWPVVLSDEEERTGKRVTELSGVSMVFTCLQRYVLFVKQVLVTTEVRGA